MVVSLCHLGSYTVRLAWHAAWSLIGQTDSLRRRRTMRPMAAAAVGALISGVAMYAVGARAQQENPFAEAPALVQTVDGQYVQIPGARPLGYATALQPAAVPVAAPVVVQRTAAPQRTVYRTTEPRTVYRAADPVQEQVVVERAP